MIITANGNFKSKEDYILFLEASIDAIVKSNKDKSCNLVAEENNGDYYYTCSKCEEKHIFMCGTPEDNNYHYCCNCGAKIDKIEYPEEEE